MWNDNEWLNSRESTRWYVLFVGPAISVRLTVYGRTVRNERDPARGTSSTASSNR